MSDLQTPFLQRAFVISSFLALYQLHLQFCIIFYERPGDLIFHPYNHKSSNSYLVPPPRGSPPPLGVSQYNSRSSVRSALSAHDRCTLLIRAAVSPSGCTLFHCAGGVLYLKRGLVIILTHVYSPNIFYKRHPPYGEYLHQDRSIYDRFCIEPIQSAYRSPLYNLHTTAVHSLHSHHNIDMVLDWVFHKYGRRSGLDVSSNAPVPVPDSILF